MSATSQQKSEQYIRSQRSRPYKAVAVCPGFGKRINAPGLPSLKLKRKLEGAFQKTNIHGYFPSPSPVRVPRDPRSDTGQVRSAKRH
ncbi:hypothetical protein DPV78_000419 [Talaromyces pinophilus]|nr:hypothetical protein DPV78_000419 [Talaromyces pinophilus]